MSYPVSTMARPRMYLIPCLALWLDICDLRCRLEIGLHHRHLTALESLLELTELRCWQKLIRYQYHSGRSKLHRLMSSSQNPRLACQCDQSATSLEHRHPVKARPCVCAVICLLLRPFLLNLFMQFTIFGAYVNFIFPNRLIKYS